MYDATVNNVARDAYLAGLLLLAMASYALPTEAATPGWLRYDIPETNQYAFRYVPASLPTGQPAPVVVFLHGSGSFPEHWQALLEPVAEAVGCVVVLPKSHHNLGFGVGPDDVTIAASLARLRAELSVDEQRIALAGHSAGGAYALVLAYASVSRFSAVFAMGAPFRTVLAVADPDYIAPLRFYYGRNDPNYTGLNYLALRDQFARLGVPQEAELAPGHGHSDWPEGTLEAGFAFLLAQRYQTAGGCQPSPTRLCLEEGRFAVEASFRDRFGFAGQGQVSAARTADSGLFWFFRDSNWELQVKVLDGCGVNGHFWVFAAGSTNVEFTLTVTDLSTGLERTYENPQGRVAVTVTDTTAFASCP